MGEVDKAKSARRNKRNGRAFEKFLAERLGASRGQALLGDIDLVGPDWSGEAKSYTPSRGPGTRSTFIQQLEAGLAQLMGRDESRGPRFLFMGKKVRGKGYEVLVVTPLEEWEKWQGKN